MIKCTLTIQVTTTRGNPALLDIYYLEEDKMRKILAMILVAAMLLSCCLLASCGSPDTGKEPGVTTPTSGVTTPTPGGNNNDTPGGIEGGDNDPEADANKPRITVNNISYAYGFSGGVANISVSVSVEMPDGEGGYLAPKNKIYGLAIDKDGNVLHMGAFMSYYQNGLRMDGDVVYNTAGEKFISPEIQGYDEIVFDNLFGDLDPCDAGLFLVKKVETSFSGNVIKYGVINAKGEWEVPLAEDHPIQNYAKTHELYRDEIDYLGNGIYALQTGMFDFVYYNAFTNQITKGYERVEFDGNDLIKYNADGTSETLLSECDASIGNNLILAGVNGRFGLADFNGEVVRDFGSNYNISTNSAWFYNNGYFLGAAYNPDGDMYCILIDPEGKLAFEPFEIGRNDAYILLDDGIGYYNENGELYLYDFKGNATKIEEDYRTVLPDSYDFESGLMIADVYYGDTTSYCYINAKGEKVLDVETLTPAIIEAILEEYEKAAE